MNVPHPRTLADDRRHARGPERAATGRSPAIGGRRINLLYVPALVVLIVFTAYPFAQGVLLSMTDWNGYDPERSFVGLDNYVRMLGDPVVGTALSNTLVYGVGSTLVQQIVGLALALVLDRVVRGRAVARAIVYLPVLVSPVVMGSMYYLLFAYSQGGVNELVVSVGGERVAWLSDGALAVAIIVLVNSMQFVGISMVIYLAGLQTIPVELRDAQRIDGASGLRGLVSVTLPLLRPAIVTSVVLNLVGGLKLFDVIRVMTGGGPGHATESLSTLISRLYFDSESAGYASAVGVALFLVIGLVTVGVNAALHRRRMEIW